MKSFWGTCSAQLEATVGICILLYEIMIGTRIDLWRFFLLALQLENYVNKARTSGCMYTPGEKEDHRGRETEYAWYYKCGLLNFISIYPYLLLSFCTFDWLSSRNFLFHLDYIFMFMCSSKKQRTHVIDYPRRVVFFSVHSSSSV